VSQQPDQQAQPGFAAFSTPPQQQQQQQPAAQPQAQANFFDAFGSPPASSGGFNAFGNPPSTGKFSFQSQSDFFALNMPVNCFTPYTSGNLTR